MAVHLVLRARKPAADFHDDAVRDADVTDATTANLDIAKDKSRATRHAALA